MAKHTMKNTIMIFVAAICYLVYFLLLSSIVYVISDLSYVAIIHDYTWIMVYTLFVSWWLIVITLHDIDTRFFSQPKN